MSLTLPYGIAVLVRCLTLSLIALGIVLQRKSHLQNDQKPADRRKNALRRPLWHLGFWMYVLSSVVGDLVGISSLPLLVIAPLTTFVLFFNAIFSKWVLKEEMSLKGWIGTVIIAISSVVLAILLNLPADPKTADEMRKNLLRPGYLAYCSINVVVLAICFLAIWYCKRNLVRWNDNDDKQTNEAKFARTRLYIALLYQLTSTILAAQALVFAKMTFDLIKELFHSHIGVGVLIVTIVTTIWQLILFNSSLHYYSTLVTVPFGYSIGIILACVNTLVYYDSFSLLAPWKIVVVAMSIVGTIGGIWLLSV
jgi:hypothetical protein